MLRAVYYAQMLFPDFLLIFLGYLVCRFTPLGRSVWQPVEALVYYLLFPVLLFQSISRSPIEFGAASGLIAAGLISGVSGILLSYALPYIPGLRRHINAREHAGAAQIAFRFNSFIGLALAERLGGPQGLQLIALLIGISVPLFNVAAVWPMARQGEHHFVRELVRNPFIIATVLGLGANMVGFTLPEVLAPPLSRIGTSALTLGLMAAGAGMQFGSLRHSQTLTVSVLAIRHLAQPLVAWCAARWMGLDPMQTAVLLAFSALPTSSSSYVLAARMGYNGPYVAGLVTLSTVLGPASLTLALSVLGPNP